MSAQQQQIQAVCMGMTAVQAVYMGMTAGPGCVHGDYSRPRLYARG